MTSSFLHNHPKEDFPAVPYHHFLPELHQIGSLYPMLRDVGRLVGWQLEYHAASPETAEARRGKISVGPIPDTEELPVPLTPNMVRELVEAEDVWIPVPAVIQNPDSACGMAAFPETEDFSHEESLRLLEYMEDGEDEEVPEASILEKKLPRLDRTSPIGFLHLFRKPEVPGKTAAGRKKSGKDTQEAISLSQAKKLAESLADMISEWQSTRLHLWKLEAEMVRHSPVFNRPHPTDEKHFAERFRLLLEYARQMLGVDAIGIYLMDEQGVSLKLRHGIGLPLDRFLKPARPWKKLIPDAMAMQGDIVFYDEHTPHGWLPPEEDFSAAMCLPLVTGHSQFGTVWFYSDKSEVFTGEETILHMELMADHISLDLEREAAYRNHLLTQAYEDELREASKFQKNQLPVPSLWSETWDFVGWTSAGRTVQTFCEEADPSLFSRKAKPKKEPRIHPDTSVSGDFYDWFLIPGQDEKIVFALGNAGVRGLAGACVASAVKTALRAHAAYDLSAGELLRSINHTLWMQSAADGRISLCCGVIENKKGKQTVRFASAGTLDALYFHDSRGAEACRVLTPPSVGKPCDFLGAGPELSCTEKVLRLKQDEFLLLFSDGVSFATTRQARLRRKQELEQLLQRRRSGSAEMILSFARNYIRNKTDSPPGRDRSVLVIKRK